MAVVALAGLPTVAAADDEETCIEQPDNLAVAVCSRAIESRQFTGRSLARMHARRGGAYQALGDTKRALADYNASMRIDPTYPASYLNRGNAWFHGGDFDRAFADYDQAIKLDPKYQAAYGNRGSAWGSKGDFDRAIADFDQAIKLDPKDADAYYGRGRALGGKGTSTGPWRTITKRSSSIRNMRAPTYNRGSAWGNKGDLDRAIADYNQAIRLDPEESQSLLPSRHGAGDERQSASRIGRLQDVRSTRSVRSRRPGGCEARIERIEAR